MRRLFVGWAVALLMTFLGLIPTMIAPVLGDDLVVLAEGFAARTSGDSPVRYALDYAQLMIAGGHVLPVGGFLSALQVSLVEVMSRTGLSVSLVWGATRVLLMIGGLVALAFTLGYWINQVSRSSHPSRISQHSLVVYLLASAMFIGTLQVHGAWSQDPVLSYALASWGTPLLGLLFFLVASAIFFGRNEVVLLPVLLALGVVGVLLYEPFVVAIGASLAALFAHVLLSRSGREERVQFVKVVLVSACVLLCFLLIQVWRISQPSEYSGTQPGFADLILPTWVTGFLSSVPFVSASLAVQQPSPGDNQLTSLAVPVISSLSLAVIAMVTVRRTFGQTITLRVLVPPVVFLLLLWAGTALVFATSSKYQMEIGTQLGRTYLFYATGALAVGGLVALVVLWLSPRSHFVFPIFAVAITLAAALQWTLNARTLGTIEEMYGWTRSAADSLERLGPLEERCAIVQRLEQDDIPDFYRTGVIGGLNATYDQQFRTDYCPAAAVGVASESE